MTQNLGVLTAALSTGPARGCARSVDSGVLWRGRTAGDSISLVRWESSLPINPSKERGGAALRSLRGCRGAAWVCHWSGDGASKVTRACACRRSPSRRRARGRRRGRGLSCRRRAARRGRGEGHSTLPRPANRGRAGDQVPPDLDFESSGRCRGKSGEDRKEHRGRIHGREITVPTGRVERSARPTRPRERSRPGARA